MIFIYDDMQVVIDPFYVTIPCDRCHPDEFEIKIDKDIPPKIADEILRHDAPKRILIEESDEWWQYITPDDLNPEYWILRVPESGNILIAYGAKYAKLADGVLRNKDGIYL